MRLESFFEEYEFRFRVISVGEAILNELFHVFDEFREMIGSVGDYVGNNAESLDVLHDVVHEVALE